jgi:hypothetical protein
VFCVSSIVLRVNARAAAKQVTARNLIVGNVRSLKLARNLR